MRNRFLFCAGGGKSSATQQQSSIEEELWVWLHRLLSLARTAAVLLRLLQQTDLFLEQLIFQLHAVKFQIQLLLQFRLANAAFIEAALDEQARCRQSDLLLPGNCLDELGVRFAVLV